MKTLLITGGSGFIGRNVQEYFKDKYTVLAPTHKDLDLLDAVSVQNFFNTNSVDYVINTAMAGVRKEHAVPDKVEKNVRMYYNLKHYGSYNQLIQLGSGAEYDKTMGLKKVSELGINYIKDLIPSDSYGLSKYIIGRDIAEDIHAIDFRLFGVYGKHEDMEYKFISNTIVKCMMGRTIRIRKNVVFDWLYVQDLMRIIEDFLGNPSRYRAYNITPTRSLDLVTIAEIINEAADKPVDVEVSEEGLNLEYTGDNSRLMSRYTNGFKFTPFEDSIIELTEYYTSIIDTIDTDRMWFY
jgi:GDP-L-fucose synthase